jgi:integrase
MFAEWEKRYSPSTMQTRRTCLGSVFGVAVDMGYLRVNPCHGIKLPKIEHHDPAYLSEDQIRILFGVLEGTKYLLPTIIAAHTGMRRGEVLGLTWDKVLWEQKALIVNASLEEGSNRIKATKSQRGALVPVSDDLLAELKRHQVLQNTQRLSLGTKWQNRNLVITREDGGPLTPTALSQGFRKYATKAGLDITFHGLRHSHASLLLLKGIHMKVVQERLRHSSMGITGNLYSHVAPTMQREAAEMTTGLKTDTGKVVSING